MHEITAQLQGNAPVIIHHQLRAMRRTDLARQSDLALHFIVGLILQAQLHQPHTQRDQPRQLGDIADNQVKRVQPGHCVRSAMPKTGVEATAISRRGMIPARHAARPAATA